MLRKALWDTVTAQGRTGVSSALCVEKHSSARGIAKGPGETRLASDAPLLSLQGLLALSLANGAPR